MSLENAEKQLTKEQTDNPWRPVAVEIKDYSSKKPIQQAYSSPHSAVAHLADLYAHDSRAAVLFKSRNEMQDLHKKVSGTEKKFLDAQDSIKEAQAKAKEDHDKHEADHAKKAGDSDTKDALAAAQDLLTQANSIQAEVIKVRGSAMKFLKKTHPSVFNKYQEEKKKHHPHHKEKDDHHLADHAEDDGHGHDKKHPEKEIKDAEDTDPPPHHAFRARVTVEDAEQTLAEAKSAVAHAQKVFSEIDAVVHPGILGGIFGKKA